MVAPAQHDDVVGVRLEEVRPGTDERVQVVPALVLLADFGLVGTLVVLALHRAEEVPVLEYRGLALKGELVVGLQESPVAVGVVLVLVALAQDPPLICGWVHADNVHVSGRVFNPERRAHAASGVAGSVPHRRRLCGFRTC